MSAGERSPHVGKEQEMAAEPINAIQIFYSYASEKDEELLRQLEKHLSILRWEGLFTSWHKGKVDAGEEMAREIETRLKTADLILLLVSADFLDSNSCYSVEMQGALERHKAGDAQVIPIILRAVDWSKAPFSNLTPLPDNGKPITSWENRDEAFTLVAKGIRKVVEDMSTKRWLNQGYASYGLNRYEEALNAFDQALRLSPESPDAYRYKSRSLYQLKRYQESLTAFDQAIRLAPNSADAYCYKGRSLYQSSVLRKP